MIPIDLPTEIAETLVTPQAYADFDRLHAACLEMRVLLEELLPRLDSVEQTGPMTMSVASFVGGPKRLPIRYRLR